MHGRYPLKLLSMRPSPLVMAGSDRCKSTASSDVRVARTKESSPSAVTSSIDAPALPSAVSTLWRLSEGTSRVTETRGSQTTDPAARSASMTTIGVKYRKSEDEEFPRREGGPSATP